MRSQPLKASHSNVHLCHHPARLGLRAVADLTASLGPLLKEKVRIPVWLCTCPCHRPKIRPRIKALYHIVLSIYIYIYIYLSLSIYLSIYL